MVACANSIRSVLLMTVLCLFGANVLAAQQTATGSPAPGGSYRIAGTVVSKADAHLLPRARITLTDVKDREKTQSIVTAEDGKFEFTGLPAGKYSLTGAKRGFISASYDQHDRYSTAIVTGAGLDTEALVLRLAPDAVIAGKVLDEFGDPVRHAVVTLYFDDHSTGVDQIRQSRSAPTDDQGTYELTPLMPGTYFLSASSKPWYAVHPSSDLPKAKRSKSEADDSEPETQPAPTFDRSLDVAYPVTYYSDVTETDSATPIPLRGGERLQVDVHLMPVPALHLLFHVPSNGMNGYTFPQLQQPAFDGSTFVQTEGGRMVSPGVLEVTGIPAGRYNVRLQGSGGAAVQMDGVDLSKDGEEVDVTKANAVSSLKVSVQIPGETALPPHLTIGLRSGRRVVASSQSIDAKGVAELQQVAAGRYEVAVWGGGKPYSILRMSAEGAEVSGHTLTLSGASSPSISLTLIGGSVEVQGTVKRAGKAFAGAMVVLVPKNAEGNRDLFRRDQSDLDGTFVLHNVVPGSYTVLAINDGWDLDWSQPSVIAAYLKWGRRVEVGGQSARPVDIAEGIEAQSK
jgi:uncharacterized surface anchored protein